MEHGPTPLCVGCRALTNPTMGVRTHTAECRARFELLLSASDIGKARVDKTNEKFTEAIVNIEENEVKKRKMISEGNAGILSSSGARGSNDPAPGIEIVSPSRPVPGGVWAAESVKQKILQTIHESATTRCT